MKEITTCEVINTKDKKQMTIIAEWLNEEVKIVLLRSEAEPLIGETATTNIFDPSRSEKTRQEFLQDLRNELSGKDKDVQFSLQETRLVWQKKIWRRVIVEMQPFESVTTLGTMNVEWLSKFSNLHATTLQLREENAILKKNTDELVSKLKEMERMKKSMEDSLYKQFLLLLNSKKRKIRELEEKLVNQEVTDGRSVYEENTDVSDDEQDEKLFNLRKRPKQEEEASTSKRISKSPRKLSQDSDDEIVLRYDESQMQDFSKLNTEEDPEDDLFSQ